MQESKVFKRLPEEIVPRHYNLLIIPDLKTFNFEGEVCIKIQVVKPTNRILLNSTDLKFIKVVLKDNNGIEQEPLEIAASVENETIEFSFSKEITSGNYEFFIKYTGEINDNMRGLYRSKNVNKNGEITYAAATQFESTFARRCFPCWDEPSLKSTFDISLLVSKMYVALSNMPVKNITSINELIRYDFDTTPIMSTYLVALVIGEYDYVEKDSADGVLVRVYTPPGKKDQGHFALEVATKVLPYYKDYFNIAYPLPKMDLIAIADFDMIAMENWGLLTFQESGILVDSQNTSSAQKQYIALLIGHEIAHQWFGNLVTMEWWTHLWLNEGYASFVEYLCVDHLFPEYDIWTQFVNHCYLPALELDCLANSHPIEVPISHPSEISGIFDNISYNKGASIIRMLHHYIGDEDFRKGMHLYLTRHQYKSTCTEDLWAALECASKKPIADIMSTWTKQMGFPRIEICSRATNEGKDVILSFTQSKFGLESYPVEKYLWKVPIFISTSKNPKEEILITILDQETTEIVVENVGLQDWIKVNPGIFGFYRTSYSPAMLKQLVPAIRDNSLSALDRLGLLGDLFAVVLDSHTSVIEVLRLLPAYKEETDYTVWLTICRILTKLDALLAYTDCEANFKNFQKNLLSKVSQTLGWFPNSNETHLDTLLRGLILEQMSLVDDEKNIIEAQKQFDAHIGGEALLPADLRSACYKTVLRAGNHHTFEILMELYRSTDLSEEKDRIGRAFGATKIEDLLTKALQFSISEEVRSQDAISIIISVASSRSGRNLTWQFFKNSWAEFKHRYQGSFRLNHMIKLIIENFASEEMALEIETFFKDHNLPGTERTIKQALETVRSNAVWLARDVNAVKSFLNAIDF